MKKIVLISFWLCSCLMAFAQGIDFRTLSFSEALERAKADNKMLFVDCYTSWCGPCKYMADSIFTQEPAGTYFNNRFISVKYDMEKEEGKEFAALYSVRSYPTFWIFSANGEVVSRIGGASRTADDWLSRVESALEEGARLEKARRDYRKNKSEKNLKAYLDALARINYGEGLCDLFIDQFNETPDKIDFLYQNKNLIVKNLSSVHFSKFMTKLKSCKGYTPEMDLIFEGVFF